MRVIVETREIAAEYRLKHWAEIIQERNESGMSIKAYCNSIGLRQNVYHYWQRKLREAAVITSSEQKEQEKSLLPYIPSELVAKEKGISCPPTQGEWAICEVTKPEPGEGTIQIEIGKSRVTADQQTNYELLAKVCKMLVTLC